MLAREERHAVAGSLEIRAALLDAVRRFFRSAGYLEVDTPALSRHALPEVNIEPIVCPDFGVLLPSPELFMKQLLAKGYEKIFQICKCFRAGEIGTRHRQEFTMLEWYRKQANYWNLMEECEALIAFIANSFAPKIKPTRKGKTVAIIPPFARMEMKEAFASFAPYSLSQALNSSCFDEIFATTVEPRLPREEALFLWGYPAEGFAKTQSDAPAFAERFELYIGGLEIANGCSEIETEQENTSAIKRSLAQRATSGKKLNSLPPFYASNYQLPPSAGCALGIDRLVMLFAGEEDIGSVLAFDEFAR
ncbi:MAG: EF-P lysine aminoacylase GenX [Deltaproteobacteria bacterium]|nr:EF-P lysine aminoacylase GenX [Deltaproteobacteria bacterium]